MNMKKIIASTFLSISLLGFSSASVFADNVDSKKDVDTAKAVQSKRKICKEHDKAKCKKLYKSESKDQEKMKKEKNNKKENISNKDQNKENK